MRKSTALRRSMLLGQSSSNLRVVDIDPSAKERLLKKRSSFNRSSVDVSTFSKSEINLLNSTAGISDVKSAIIVRYTLCDHRNEISQVTAEFEVEVKMQNLAAAKGTLRASFSKTQKKNGKLLVGEGCIMIKMSDGELFHSEISNIMDLSLIKRGGKETKEFSLMCHESDKIITVKPKAPKDVEEAVKRIFTEARSQACVLEECLLKLLPEDWKLAIQSDSHNNSTLTKSNLLALSNNNSIKLSKIDPRISFQVEICLRAHLDLLSFSKGESSMDTFEAQERFSKWLEFNGKLEEASYWGNLAGENLRKYEQGRNISELDRYNDEEEAEVLGKKPKTLLLLDEIRNPKSLEKVMEMRQLAHVENMQERIDVVMKRLEIASEQNFATKKDQYEELI